MNKIALLIAGKNIVKRFCEINFLPIPKVWEIDRAAWQFDHTCAYYRNDEVKICIAKCASIGVAGRQWSYPGYTVDRTPYGVVQHELGHHVDFLRAKNWRRSYFSDFSVSVRGNSGEKPITSYCPNDAEWFAEMFRVFVTNPDLLKLLRPRTYRELSASLDPLFTDTWRDRLAGAPDRTIRAAENHIDAARSQGSLL